MRKFCTFDLLFLLWREVSLGLKLCWLGKNSSQLSKLSKNRLLDSCQQISPSKFEWFWAYLKFCGFMRNYLIYHGYIFLYLTWHCALNRNLPELSRGARSCPYCALYYDPRLPWSVQRYCIVLCRYPDCTVQYRWNNQDFSSGLNIQFKSECSDLSWHY